MKLLILTQAVDRNDPLLGFFHRWVEEFAKHCTQVTVIALGIGEYHLPDNVRVFSLGKEQLRKRTDLGNSKRSVLKEQLGKMKYIIRFYRLIWRERKNYDGVFVHMNQEYVLLGGLLWKLMRKRIILWRNHPLGDLGTRIAVLFSNTVFCTSPHAYVARFKKTESGMPVGIDTHAFTDTHKKREEGSVVSIGRISPIKKILEIVEVVRLLKEKGWWGKAYLYGSAPERDRRYEAEVVRAASSLEQAGMLVRKSSVPYGEIAQVYNKYELYINLTPTGSFDKTVFEAAACGVLVLVSNQSFVGKIPDACICREEDAGDCAQKAQQLLALSRQEKDALIARLRAYVENEQGITQLTRRVMDSFSAP